MPWPRWPVLLVLGLPLTLHAIEYNSSDVVTALQRHDLRQLQALASSGGKPLRLEALEGLVRVNDPQVVPFLVAQLTDPEPDIVQAALWSLPNYAEAASPQVIARVEEMQQHSSVDVRKAATVVLEDLKDPEQLKQMHTALVTRESEQHKEALEFYIQRKDLSILLSARQMLEDPDPFLKQTGILLVHGLDDRDRLDVIIHLLQDPAPTVRAPAAQVIGSWKESAAFPILAPLLKDPDPLVRASVVYTLGKHQDPEVSIALGVMTKDPSPTVRIALAKSLGQFAYPGDVQALLALLHDKDDEVRLNAVRGLLQIPGAEARGHLVYLLEDPRKDIRLVLLKNLDNLLKLPNVNKSVVKRSLVKLEKDPDPEIRSLAKKHAEALTPPSHAKHKKGK